MEGNDVLLNQIGEGGAVPRMTFYPSSLLFAVVLRYDVAHSHRIDPLGCSKNCSGTMYGPTDLVCIARFTCL